MTLSDDDVEKGGLNRSAVSEVPSRRRLRKYGDSASDHESALRKLKCKCQNSFTKHSDAARVLAA